MKSFVLYSSQSGNTKKLADTIYETLPGDKKISPVDEPQQPFAEIVIDCDELQQLLAGLAVS